MGMFDFLKSKDVPVVAQMGPGGLMQAPTMEHQPGFVERSRTPDASGQSLADRILMAAMVMNDQAPGAMQYGAGLRKKATDTADRAKKNAAIKAAYVNGKFDFNAYQAAAGPDADLTEGLSLQKELAPRTGVDGSFAYTIGNDGQVHWGEQRGMSHAEEAQLAREAEAERRNQQLEEIARGRLRVEEQNAGTNSYRAHKPAAGGAHPSGLPQGYHIVGGPR